MRDIKFRAWDNSKNEMSNPFEISGYPIFKNDRTLSYWAKVAFIMQFTGLLDKNGKEIYEGDIVLDGGLQGVLIWNSLKASFCICFEYGKEYPKWQNIRGNDQSVGNNGVQCHDIEIIGNIYENENLLNDKDSILKLIDRVK